MQLLLTQSNPEISDPARNMFMACKNEPEADINPMLI